MSKRNAKPSRYIVHVQETVSTCFRCIVEAQSEHEAMRCARECDFITEVPDGAGESVRRVVVGRPQKVKSTPNANRGQTVATTPR